MIGTDQKKLDILSLNFNIILWVYEISQLMKEVNLAS